jgi:hypothetical protein
MTLGEHLNAAARTPFAWGSHDCVTFPADWVVAQGGDDPIAAWRGTYSDELQAATIVVAGGGLEALWRTACAGMAEVAIGDELPGDVGLVWAWTEAGAALAGAVAVSGGRWAALRLDGLLIDALRPYAVWRA